MTRTRHILAVVTVTAALCADHAVAAAPLARPQVAEMAARLVDRLSRTFSRSVPSAVRPMAQTRIVRDEAIPAAPIMAAAPATHRELSPFQFRLPPPVC